jgi:hypothetical protein
MARPTSSASFAVNLFPRRSDCKLQRCSSEQKNAIAGQHDDAALSQYDEKSYYTTRPVGDTVSKQRPSCAVVSLMGVPQRKQRDSIVTSMLHIAPTPSASIAQGAFKVCPCT